MSVKQRDIFLRLSLCIVLLLATVIPIFQARSAYALQLTPRTLTLQAGTKAPHDGGSMPSGIVNHLFGFTIKTGGNVGSIKFEYCTISTGTCTMPTGLDTTTADVTAGPQTGAIGFTLDKSVNGRPFLTRTAANVNADTAVTYRLDNITNPSATNQAFYVRITTYTDAALGGTAVDTGSVTASTATQIVLTGIMPESIIFCTGAIVVVVGSIPDCSQASSGVISFNQLFSPSDTATATSQMAASTNSPSGYSITVNGETMKSGSNSIPVMTSKVVGTRGTGQFGLNLKLNTVATSTPAVGAEITQGSNGTNYRGEATANYSEQDKFMFADGGAVADSAYTVGGPTDGQVYTISYIVNVSGSQPAGTYTTTLTYICTATF